MDGSDETPWQLLTRSFSGVASSSEEAELRHWIEADPSREEFVQALRAAWAESGVLPERHDTDAAWMRVRRRVAGAPRPLRLAEAVYPAGRERPWARTLFRVAAVVIAAAGLGGILLLNNQLRTPSASRAVALRETSTRPGQRATVLLADGSRVTLAAGSTLRYPLTFGDTRELHLDGEAYFEVASDSTSPFVVLARGAETRVLGTKFVVRALAPDSAVVVAVAEGKVALSRAGDTALSAVRAAVLTRGEVGRLAPGGEAAVLVGADAAQYLAWTEGRLLFRDTPLRDVIPELSRWYGLDVRFAPGAERRLGDRRFTGTFANQPADEVLTFLALSAELRVTREEGRVTLSPKRRAR
jgi:transmembrane sensor